MLPLGRRCSAPGVRGTEGPATFPPRVTARHAASGRSLTSLQQPVVPGWDVGVTRRGRHKRIGAVVAPETVSVSQGMVHAPNVDWDDCIMGQLYNLNSKYGSKEELKELTEALNKAGIIPVADIVINHRCADEQVDGVWNKYRDDVDHMGRRIDWGAWAITSNDPNFKGTGNPDTGEDYGPAPDLDHMNPDLRTALKDWLKWLHEDIGFGGWRLDFVKGYGARFVPEYINASLPPGCVNVGEYWADLKWNGSDLEYNQDDSRRRITNWIKDNQETCAGFDFTTKGILQEAIRKTRYHCLRDQQGKAPGLMGWWPQRSVTFIDNHDTGSTQKHWPFPSEHVALGYAYIMTHPGMPCLFWEHYFDWGNTLQKTLTQMVEIRKRNGVKAGSKLEILCAEADMYVARINNSLVLKLGPRYDMGNHVPKEKDGWFKALSGKDWCIWEKNPK